MRYLITGGAGFIGSHLADAHLTRGDDVVILDDLSTGRRENVAHLAANPHFEFIEGSILDAPVLERAIASCDAIYHMAAAVGVQRIMEQPLASMQTNVTGTHAVLETAAKHGTRILVASTSEVYGVSDRVPFREDDVLVIGSTSLHRWSYACAKALDEFLALAYRRERGLPATIVRLFNTVGPRQSGRYGMVIPRFVRQALAGEPITVHGTGDQTRCFGYVGEVVTALVSLFDKPECAGTVFNIGSTEEISIMALAQRIKGLTSSNSEIRTIPYDEAYDEGYQDIPRRLPDLTRISNAVGYRHATTLDEILKSVIDSMRAPASAALR